MCEKEKRRRTFSALVTPRRRCRLEDKSFPTCAERRQDSLRTKVKEGDRDGWRLPGHQAPAAPVGGNSGELWRKQSIASSCAIKSANFGIYSTHGIDHSCAAVSSLVQIGPTDLGFFLTEIRFYFIFFPTLRTIFFSVIKFGLQLTVLVVSP